MAEQDKQKEAEQQKGVERSLDYSVTEGCSFSLMQNAGEAFVSPLAVAINSSPAEIGLLRSIPQLCASFAQWHSANITDKIRNRKQIIVYAVLLQAITWLPMIFISLFVKSPALLIISFTLYAAFGALAEPAWYSLIGDLIDENKRGSFFGRRNRATSLVGFVSMLAAGIVLQVFAGIDRFIGFAILFAVAFLARLYSAFLNSKMYEPKYEVAEESRFSFAGFLKRLPFTNYGKFAIYRCAMAFSVNLAGPFFTVYMLRDLGISYFGFTLITMASMVTTFLVTRYWGRYADFLGNRTILNITGFLVPLVPLPWLFSSDVTYLVIIQVIGGFAWAGFDLAATSFFFDAVRPVKRARVIGYFNVLLGVSIFLGATIGGLLGGLFTPINTGIFVFSSKYHLLFVVSVLLRLASSIVFLPTIREVRITEEQREKDVFIKLVAIEPTRGVIDYGINMIKTARSAAHDVAKKQSVIITQTIDDFLKYIDESIKVIELTRRKRRARKDEEAAKAKEEKAADKTKEKKTEEKK